MYFAFLRHWFLKRALCKNAFAIYIITRLPRTELHDYFFLIIVTLIILHLRFSFIFPQAYILLIYWKKLTFDRIYIDVTLVAYSPFRPAALFWYYWRLAFWGFHIFLIFNVMRHYIFAIAPPRSRLYIFGQFDYVVIDRCWWAQQQHGQCYPQYRAYFICEPRSSRQRHASSFIVATMP